MNEAVQLVKIAKSLIAKNFKRDFMRELIRRFKAMPRRNGIVIPIEDKYISIGRVVGQNGAEWHLGGWFRNSSRANDYAEDVEHDVVNDLFRKYRGMPESEDGLDKIEELVKILKRK